MKRALIILAVALAVAACAGGEPIRVAFTDNVGSYCAESKSEYDGHRLACISLARTPRACPIAEMKAAQSVRAEASKICDASPADTPANRTKVKALVEKQRAIGSAL
jgi:hypothetical protein